jgi:hypothetical protein
MPKTAMTGSTIAVPAHLTGVAADAFVALLLGKGDDKVVVDVWIVIEGLTLV